MNAVAVATWLVCGVLLYLGCGVLFAIPFLARGAAAIDPAAREGTWGFRVIVLPGVVALWPVLLRRWLSGSGAPAVERTAHRRVAQSAQPARAGGSSEERV